MGYSATETAQKHERILDESIRLFREKGFDGVPVADLMREAGLTHGGFYNHFGSKEELEAAACERVFEGALERLSAIADIPDPQERKAAADAYRLRYVSIAARDARATADRWASPRFLAARRHPTRIR